jgi:hypothetical protein
MVFESWVRFVPCRYLVNIFFDCTFGIVINLLVLRGFEILIMRNGMDMQTGNYGSPPQFSKFMPQFVSSSPLSLDSQSHSIFRLLLWLFVCVIGKMIVVVFFVLGSRGVL